MVFLKYIKEIIIIIIFNMLKYVQGPDTLKK